MNRIKKLTQLYLVVSVYPAGPAGRIEPDPRSGWKGNLLGRASCPGGFGHVESDRR